MHSRLWPGKERAALAVLLVGVGTVWACGGEQESEQGSETLAEAVAETVADSAQDTTVTLLHRFLPDDMRRSTRAITFPHEAHVQIDCNVCHELPEGHTTHGELQCADCHRASALATVRELSTAQCAACHHGAQQTLTCLDCHDRQGGVSTQQVFALGVWSTPRTRTLSFDHDVHVELDCLSCHRSSPLLTPAEACGSCHAEHHDVGVRCQSCHTPPPPTAHDVQAHLTCSGAGCHRAPEVQAIASDRAVCLACHTAQEEHEPGGVCIECHRVRPGLERSGP